MLCQGGMRQVVRLYRSPRIPKLPLWFCFLIIFMWIGSQACQIMYKRTLSSRIVIAGGGMWLQWGEMVRQFRTSAGRPTGLDIECQPPYDTWGGWPGVSPLTIFGGAGMQLSLPMWLLLAAGVAWFGGVCILRARVRAVQHPVCTNCGYNLTGIKKPRCPECFAPCESDGAPPRRSTGLGAKSRHPSGPPNG